MTAHKAKIFFSHEVYSQIEYLTYNMNTEIGALGRVSQRTENGEKYFYVDKLYFPQQKVTGAEVHFTAAMWGDLIKKHGLAEMQNIGFYWHRHPGSAAHSSTDDEETFDAFMMPEAKRPYFLFLQTAVSGTGVWNSEARIDIRNPIRTTILDSCIDLQVEESPEHKKTRVACDEIVKDVIVKELIQPTNSVATIPVTTKNVNIVNRKPEIGIDDYHKIRDLGWDELFDSATTKIDIGNFKTLPEAIDAGMFGNINSKNDFDNDIILGKLTSRADRLAMIFKSGNARILCGVNFKKIIEKIFNPKTKPKPDLAKYVRQHTKKDYKMRDMYEIKLQPAKSSYQEMVDVLTKMYFQYCRGLATATAPAVQRENPEEVDASNLLSLQDGTTESATVLQELACQAHLDWYNVYNCNIFSFDLPYDKLGTLIIDASHNKILFHGAELIAMVKDILQTDVTYDTKIAIEEEEE